ncbi:MAG: M20/M25/M40 family metallo-hydrolase [Thaumarchaeota archaeon]|nr:M20/M25/M40 family metallo-hydrolase [Nitrososphaerota archaeon]
MSSPLEKVYRFVDSHRDEFLQGLSKLLAQPSISTLGVGINETAKMLMDVMEESGLRTRKIETSGHPFIYGDAVVGPDKPTVLIYGHYDVQPVEPIDAWATPPFQPTIRDGRIYARGAGDNKGQLYAQLMGIRSLTEILGNVPANVKCIFEGEEENGSPHLEQVVTDNRSLLKADLAITADGPLHESGRPLIVFGVRGMVYVELTARGANRDLHSGNWGGPIANPVWRLVRLLNSMKDVKAGRVNVSGFYDRIKPITVEEMKALRAIPLDREGISRELGIRLSELPEGEDYYTKLMTEPTLNICGIYGGYTGAGTKTIIPSKATAKLDARLVPDQDPDEVFGRLEKHVVEHGEGIEIKKLGSMRPSRTPLDNPFSSVIADAMRSATKKEPIIYPSLGASLPDYIFTRILGIPSFITPYANHDESNHAPNENLKIENFIQGTKCCASILSHLAGDRR